MRPRSPRVPVLVAIAAGAGLLGFLPVVWAAADEVGQQLAIGLVILLYAVTATAILVARPGNRVAGPMLAGAVAWAVGEPLLAWGVDAWARSEPSVSGAAYAVVTGSAVRGAGWLVLVLAVPLAFPDGRSAWPERRTPWVLVGGAVALLVLGSVLAPYPLDSRVAQLRSPTGVPLALKTVADLVSLAALALAAVALVVAMAGLRLKWRAADELQRLQLLWFTAAFALPLACLPLAATPWASPWLFAAVTAPTPIALGIALLQRRLYDIELLTSRSLTYVFVSISAVAVYVGTVGVVGLVLRRQGAQWLPWLGAAVIALLFTPLRSMVQRLANRITYGHWSAPAEVLAATERRLKDATDLIGLIDALVADLAELLRLPHVEVSDPQGWVVSEAGPAPRADDSDVDGVPLAAFGTSVGHLTWTRTSLRTSERALLEGVGRQLGEALHAVVLTDRLRSSQERLVLAREEERKRLRRDLHDGLGPSLASLGLDVDRLRNRLADLDGSGTDAELVRLRGAIHECVAEVRRVVEGLRPPALDELGLAGALTQLAARASLGDGGSPDPGVDATIDLDELPPLSAATEVAAYRIVQEALTNAVRHSGGHSVRLSVGTDGDELVLVVCDDGHGTVEPRPGGVGLGAMQERATLVGGRLDIVGAPGSGTHVSARLPLSSRLDRSTSAATPR